MKDLQAAKQRLQEMLAKYPQDDPISVKLQTVYTLIEAHMAKTLDHPCDQGFHKDEHGDCVPNVGLNG